MIRTILTEVALVVVVLSAFCAVTIIGRSRLTELFDDLVPRLRESSPYFAILVVVLLLNSVIREAADSLSWLIGLNITSQIEWIEGGFVAFVQSFQTELLTTYFSYIYIYGYVFLLIFPLFAYLALSDRTTFRELTIAYSLNYFLGLLLYIIFIAYGPRNLGLAENLLYDTFAQFQFLTTEVNNPTNVFPSLHTSLSATAAIFAYKTREAYFAWLPIAVVLAVSVIISTMYLGIHWATDVVAGIGLAVACVYFAERYVAKQQARVDDDADSVWAQFPFVTSGLNRALAVVGSDRRIEYPGRPQETAAKRESDEPTAKDDAD